MRVRFPPVASSTHLRRRAPGTGRLGSHVDPGGAPNLFLRLSSRGGPTDRLAADAGYLMGQDEVLFEPCGLASEPALRRRSECGVPRSFR